MEITNDSNWTRHFTYGNEASAITCTKNEHKQKIYRKLNYSVSLDDNFVNSVCKWNSCLFSVYFSFISLVFFITNETVQSMSFIITYFLHNMFGLLTCLLFTSLLITGSITEISYKSLFAFASNILESFLHLSFMCLVSLYTPFRLFRYMRARSDFFLHIRQCKIA